MSFYEKCVELVGALRYNKCMKVISYIYYLLVAAFWWCYRLVPPSKAYALGYNVGFFAFTLGKKSKRAKASIDNVLIAGCAKTRHEAYLISRSAFAHFIGHITESFRISEVITKETWPKYVTIEVPDEVKEMVFNPKEPIILATGHLGAWEAGITSFVSARPFFAVARMMDNPYIQKFMERHNFRGGATILPKKNGFSPKNLHRWIDSNGALAILFDQYASSGVRVPFFGHMLPVYTSPARLHLKTKAPIMVGGFLRTGVLKYKVVIEGDPILYKPYEDKDEAIKSITAECIGRLEKVIKRAPDQYLWLHRRFRGIPVPEVPEK